MKKWSMAAMALAAGLYATAQETGMHFEHGGTWEQALAKAKAENKYIFVDCYTTWCGPCKQMSKNIFPMASVGDFYNKNFIILKVQIDTLRDKDKKIIDSKEVQDWYATADMLEEKYNVRAYPTYLFFDPNGQIVHRAVGSSEADKFIGKGQDAMVPEKQYYSLKRKYEAGNHDEKFLYQMAMAANEAYDPKFAKEVADKYLATQKDLYTKDNLTFLQEFTQTSKDPGFKIISENPAKVDAILGKGTSGKVIKGIIMQEEIYPVLFARNASTPNWPALEATLKTKYPAQANETVLYSKVLYAQQKRDWKNFGTAVGDYMKAYGSDASPEQMNSFAWTVFQNCEDIACVTNALDWSKKSFADNNNHQFMDTYANLLYKAGKKKEAIEWETKAMEMAQKNNEDAGDYKETLDKMNKGEKTW